MTKPPHRFAEGLTAALEYLSVICVASISVLVIAQVVLRYVFNDPLTWSEEMARILFIYLSFIGIAAAYGRRRHMYIDALVILLPERMRRIVELSVVVIATAFLVTVIVLTARSMAELYRVEITTPALDFPMAYVYLIIPIGLSMLIAQMWIGLYKERKS